MPPPTLSPASTSRDAEDVIFLADHSKLGQKAAFFFADVEKLSCLITDKAADPAFIEQLQGRGVEVLQGD